MKFDINITVTLDAPDLVSAERCANDLTAEVKETGWGCLHIEEASIDSVEWDRIAPVSS